jgi:mono/diheme cytochrome c family protein
MNFDRCQVSLRRRGLIVMSRVCVGLLALGLLLPGPAGASEEAPSILTCAMTAADGTPGARLSAKARVLRRGEDLYRAHCAFCHGSSAINAGPVPDLRRSNPATIAALDAIVLGGALSASGMPSLARFLTRADMTPLQAYLTERARQLHQ